MTQLQEAQEGPKTREELASSIVDNVNQPRLNLPRFVADVRAMDERGFIPEGSKASQYLHKLGEREDIYTGVMSQIRETVEKHLDQNDPLAFSDVQNLLKVAEAAGMWDVHPENLEFLNKVKEFFREKKLTEPVTPSPAESAVAPVTEEETSEEYDASHLFGPGTRSEETKAVAGQQSTTGTETTVERKQTAASLEAGESRAMPEYLEFILEDLKKAAAPKGENEPDDAFRERQQRLDKAFDVLYLMVHDDPELTILQSQYENLEKEITQIPLTTPNPYFLLNPESVGEADKKNSILLERLFKGSGLESPLFLLRVYEYGKNSDGTKVIHPPGIDVSKARDRARKIFYDKLNSSVKEITQVDLAEIDSKSDTYLEEVMGKNASLRDQIANGEFKNLDQLVSFFKDFMEKNIDVLELQVKRAQAIKNFYKEMAKRAGLKIIPGEKPYTATLEEKEATIAEETHRGEPAEEERKALFQIAYREADEFDEEERGVK